MKEDITYTICM